MIINGAFKVLKYSINNVSMVLDRALGEPTQSMHYISNASLI